MYTQIPNFVQFVTQTCNTITNHTCSNGLATYTCIYNEIAYGQLPKELKKIPNPPSPLPIELALRKVYDILNHLHYNYHFEIIFQIWPTTDNACGHFSRDVVDVFVRMVSFIPDVHSNQIRSWHGNYDVF